MPGTGSLSADQARIWARFSAAASSGERQPGVAGQRLGGGAEEDGKQGAGVAPGLFHGRLAGPRQDGADVVWPASGWRAQWPVSAVARPWPLSAWAAARTVR